MELDGMKPHEVLAEACERLGVSHEDLADLLGITVPHVWDLEGHDDEIATTLSIAQLLRLAEVLHLMPRQLAGAGNTDLPYRPPEELRDLIRHHCDERGITVEAFSDDVGWELKAFMANPPKAFGMWNLDCLKEVCSAVERDYGEFIPKPKIDTHG